jgi:hypothetical protein
MLTNIPHRWPARYSVQTAAALVAVAAFVLLMSTLAIMVSR